ncbi:MAG: tRNA preQ1(34) S-adenosylmethionine ribosyltransferase-isomerase QueA, partial [Chloroflexota bacterium]
SQIGEYLHPDDLLVVNQTRVLAARLLGHKVPTGGKVELLLLKQKNSLEWEALVGGKRMQAGSQVELKKGVQAEIVSELSGAMRLVRFDQDITALLDQIGQTPLPPYITAKLYDAERYQTVYSKDSGSAAAPTAGLHFTPELIDSLKSKGVGHTALTLHVGLDTFAPVNEDDPQEHEIHKEWCQLNDESAQTIQRAKAAGGRIVAVGTTSVRVLETAGQNAGADEVVAPFEGLTKLFILPGYQFGVVDGMITNFHLPRSTLLMLVSAMVGRQKILNAYQEAIQAGYRFYSFGDAMLIL